MSARLSEATLDALPDRVARPAYARASLATGIVHLGLGNFHRAHQAAMTEALLDAGDRRWGIAAASLRSPAMHDALAPQDNLYTLAARDGDREQLRVIGAIRRVLVAPSDPAALVAAMSEPSVKIVTLTVTEKGYCHDPATGALDPLHPDIRHDLANPDAPRSAPGFLVAALKRRFAAGAPPFTVLCCDNLPANGRTVGRITEGLAALSDPALARRIAAEVAFPCTMVDRIVPATTDADRAHIAARLGAQDAWPVLCESYSQWVIEDRFTAGRPAWEQAGATFTADVAPFELMKLRMLNGAHSALAYLGCLAGHATVAEAANDPVFAGYLAALWAEIMPSVPAPAGQDLADYAARLLRRFANRSLQHRTAQIAMDGSQKLPQRLLEPIRAALAAGRAFPCLALAVAGWIRFVAGPDEQGRPTPLSDPLEGALRAAALPGLGDPEALVGRFLGLEAVFGADLPSSPVFRGALVAALRALADKGTRGAMAGG